MPKNDPNYRVVSERIKALDRLVQTSLEGSQRAIDKAEEAQRRRFDAVNEFRDVLSDQQNTLVTKEVVERLDQQNRTERDRLHDLYSELRVAQQIFVTDDELELKISSLRDVVGVLQSSVNRLLITLLSSFVLALVTALIYNYTQR